MHLISFQFHFSPILFNSNYRNTNLVIIVSAFDNALYSINQQSTLTINICDQHLQSTPTSNIRGYVRDTSKLTRVFVFSSPDMDPFLQTLQLPPSYLYCVLRIRQNGGFYWVPALPIQYALFIGRSMGDYGNIFISGPCYNIGTIPSEWAFTLPIERDIDATPVHLAENAASTSWDDSNAILNQDMAPVVDPSDPLDNIAEFDQLLMRYAQENQEYLENGVPVEPVDHSLEAHFEDFEELFSWVLDSDGTDSFQLWYGHWLSSQIIFFPTFFINFDIFNILNFFSNLISLNFSLSSICIALIAYATRLRKYFSFYLHTHTKCIEQIESREQVALHKEMSRIATEIDFSRDPRHFRSTRDFLSTLKHFASLRLLRKVQIR